MDSFKRQLTDYILDQIKELWLEAPDLRFGQIIVNALELQGPLPKLFYLEDEILLSKIELFFETIARQ